MRLSVIVSVSWPTVATPPSPACWVCCSVAIASPRWRARFFVLSRSFSSVAGTGSAAFLGGFPHFGHRGGRRLGAQAQRAGAVRGAPAPLRPALRAAQLRAGPALAPGDGGRGATPSHASACSTWPPGTGLVARELVRRYGCSVVGLDQSAEMLAGARREARRASPGSRSGSSWSRARPSSSPFADAEFDHLTFTYLLRYVDDPGGDARRARPRGQAGRADRLARVRPPRPAAVAAALAALHPDRPAGASAGLFGRDWYEVGRFLGPSIEELYERWPLERQLELWERRRDLAACASGA